MDFLKKINSSASHSVPEDVSRSSSSESEGKLYMLFDISLTCSWDSRPPWCDCQPYLHLSVLIKPERSCEGLNNHILGLTEKR